MLCQTCQRRGRCLPSQLAQRDRAIQQHLESLQQCEQRQPISQAWTHSFLAFSPLSLWLQRLWKTLNRGYPRQRPLVR